MEKLISKSGDKIKIGLTGEYYTLARLHQRGLTALLTLSNTKGIDILVYNNTKKKYYKVEVKTTTVKPRVEHFLSNKPHWNWPLNKKEYNRIEKDRFFCFVFLKDENTLPRFFIVPSKVVARYAKWQHQKWIKTRKHSVKDVSLTKFRIEETDPKGYENNWTFFEN